MQRVSRTQHTLSFSPAHGPVLKVRTGERFLVECPSAKGGVLDEHGQPSVPTERANAAAGPVFVDGLQPGEWMAVRLHAIRPVGWGAAQRVSYRPEGERLVFLDGVEAPLEPSLGVMGVAPRVPSDETSNDTCGPHGGNLDCRDFAAGATVFFRARVAGALLGMGDAHLAMGDGELGGQGIEAAVDVEATAYRAREASVEWPWLVRDGWVMALGGHADYRVAQRIAYEEMMTLCRNVFDLERSEAQARIAPAGHLKVCQGCCPLMTVRVALPLDILGETEERLLSRMLVKE